MTISPLRKYQAEDFVFHFEKRRTLILWEQRLGKTVEVVNLVAADTLCTRVLINCPKNAIGVWRAHFTDWFKHLQPGKTLEIRIVRGMGAKAALLRKQEWYRPATTDVVVWIATNGVMDHDHVHLMQERKRFNCVIVDEAHRRCKNRKNKSIRWLKFFTDPTHCARFHALSGTLAGKGGTQDFWTLLNLIDPKKFSSFWRYADRYCEFVETQWGKEFIGPKHIEEFKALIRSYATIRKRSECAPQMPAIQRDLLKVELNTIQRQMLMSIKDDDVYFKDDVMILASTSLEKHLRIRQILCCPAIFDAKLGVGAAMEDVIERLTDSELEEDDKFIVIFTDFRGAITPFAEALTSRGIPVQCLYGGIEPEVQEERISQWHRDRGVMLCTSQYAEAFSLAGASYCITIGYSLNPNVNKQAEDRLVPQEGLNPINSYYYCYKDTSDENMAEQVNIQQRVINTIMSEKKPINIGEAP